MSLLDKLFGDPNSKEVKRLEPIIAKINHLEGEIQKLSDTEIKERYQALKKVVEANLKKEEGKYIDPGTSIRDRKSEKKIELDILIEYLPEAFALTREAAKRTIGQRHYDVQLMGGIVLNEGKIAEMKTGEGKTLVATLAVALNALTGKGVHVVTVNDYLARRDAGWMGRVYNFLGLTTSSIIHDKALLFDSGYKDEKTLDERTEHLRQVSRKEAYLADITYGTNNEFGFDYLRDNMVQNAEQMVQRPLHFAIVDEVDSILIDEARTPLIISQAAQEATDKYYLFAKLARQLKKDTDYVVDEKLRAVTLTDDGIAHMEKLLNVDNIYEEYGIENVHHIEQSLKAEAIFKKDRDYVVKGNEVIIVDEFTGRLMEGRRYSEGLHQAIEAKEGVRIKQESITLATISFQNYFRLYTKLSGMTGTAQTEAEEFHKIYELEVTVIPSNRPMIREDMADVIYKTERAKFMAVVLDIKERHAKGQPVLVGTVSIEKNEIISDLLKRQGIKHELLNAKNHEQEAMIIENAGQKGAVTVSTNMAGRGTDILLGDGVIDLGGLHVIGTERHESRRIDNQLRGRAGRQGDPGSSQFYVSLEDDLMRIFGSDRVGSMMEKLGLPEETPIQHSLISRTLEQAQKRVENQNFDIRKHLVEYDDIMNRQREYIYAKRRQALSSDRLKDEFLEYFDSEAEIIVDSQVNVETDELNIEKITEIMSAIVNITENEKKQLQKSEATQAKEIIKKTFRRAYDEKEKELGPELIKILEHGWYLRIIDMLWIDHLDAMDHLREGIGLRAYAQKDTLVEYKNESYRMFQTLLGAIQSEVVNTFFRVNIEKGPETSEQGQGSGQPQEEEVHKEHHKAQFPTGAEEKNRKEWKNDVSSEGKKLITNRDEILDYDESTSKAQKVGRNDPCPCGSGKKYKKCCGK